MKRYPDTVRVFLRRRMLCVGCQVGPFHTISDACEEYRLNEDRFRRELAQAVSEAPRSRPG
ncbi:DUF1858 domain-containing protein [Marivita sp. GX14005]|nr:DUF1858 domain-containing protein [Marivita sp. GX14005]